MPAKQKKGSMTDARKVTEVLDAEGGVVQATYAAPRITVSFERKISDAHGLPQYESASAYAAVQADTALDGSDKVTAITEAFALAKGAVLAQLGITSTVDDVGIVVEKLIEVFNATPAPNAPRAQSSARSTGAAGPKKDQASLWAELSTNPDKYFDNRNDKRNEKAPDFKRKGTGEGLWLTDKDGTNNADKFGATLPS